MYEIFERLMKERGVTATDVSRATGIARASLTDWKKGRSSPKLDKLQLLANYFEVPLETFTAPMNATTSSLRSRIYAASARLEDDMRKKVTDDIEQRVTEAVRKALEDLPDGQPGWYYDDEAAREAQEMFEDEDMRALFHMKRNMNPDKFKAHMDMMKQLYRLEHPEDHPEEYE